MTDLGARDRTEWEPEEAAEGFTVGEMILWEMEARGWSQEEVARRMGGDFRVQILVLDFCFCQASFDRDIAIHFARDEATAAALENAFGIDKDWWLRIDEYYRRWRAGPKGFTKLEVV